MKKTYYIPIYLMIAVFFYLVTIMPQSLAQETDCTASCYEKDYPSALKCYETTRSKADANLVVAQCALNQNDNDEAEKYALGSARWRLEWVSWINKLKIPNVRIQTGGTAESYMTAYVATGKEEYKEKGISYAMTSGQCIDGDSEEKIRKCAQGYFDSYVGNLKRNLNSSNMVLTGRNTNPELAARTCNGFSEFYSWLSGKCKCKKGFETLDGVCTLDVYKDSGLTTESAVELEEYFNNLKLKEAGVLEVTLTDKTTIKLGIAKSSAGRPLYSEDGIEWEDDIKKITSQGLMDKLNSAWEWTENLNPVNLFHAKWKDDEPGQNKEIKWKIAQNILEQFKEDSKEPALYEEQFTEWVIWLTEQPDAMEEFLGSIEDKEIGEAVQEKSIESVKDGLYEYFIGFPAASVEKFASEINTDDFFQAVYYYIREREAGKTPEFIQANQPEEMEFAVSVATVETFGKVTYFNKLEESYQHYRVWQMLMKDK